jgi:hypothetical protein
LFHLHPTENQQVGSLHRFRNAIHPGERLKELNSLTNQGLFSSASATEGQFGRAAGLGSSGHENGQAVTLGWCDCTIR